VIPTTIWWWQKLGRDQQRINKFHMEMFDLKESNEVEDREKYHVEVSNRFTALEDLGTVVEINSAWEKIKENITISAKGRNCSGYRIQVKYMGII
jgi:histidinol phosphatase-like PHP family hydrolase